MSNEYLIRHLRAMQETRIERARHTTTDPTKLELEAALVAMTKAWLMYARAHGTRYESAIGQDGVLGEYWNDIGIALRGLLNGETGRLDAGTMDGDLVRALREVGGIEV